MSPTNAGRAKTALCAALCAALLSGCSGQSIYSGYREIDQMELVETLGADRDGEDVVVSISTNAERESQGKPTVLINRAQSISEALGDLPAFSPKRYLFFGHTEYFVLGQQAAEEGLSDFLDYIGRAVEMRLDTRMYIVKGGDALTLVSEVEDVSAMLDSVELSVKDQSEGYVYSFGEIAQSLLHNGAALVTAVEAVPAEEFEPGAEGDTVYYSGYAVIKDGKLAAFADKDCSKGINLLTGQVEGGIVTVDDGQGGVVSLRLTDAAMEVEPEFENGSLTRLRIKFDLEANVDELQHEVDVFSAETMDALERELCEKELERIKAAMELSLGLGVDFMGLEKKTELAAPGDFEKMPEEWEVIFPELDIEISADAVIRRSYDISGFLGAGRD